MVRVAVAAVFLLVASGTRALAADDDTQAAGDAAQAAGDDTEEHAGAVIPPGQEELLAAMLGRGAALPGPCTFAGGAVERTIVKATYTCPQGAVVFELQHPSTAPPGATRTERFAIALQSGSPPNGLADALAALVRSREAGFEWKWVEPRTERPSSTRVVVLSAAVLLGIAVLALALRRRRRVATTA